MNSSFPVLQIQVSAEEIAAAKRFLTGTAGTGVAATRDEGITRALLRKLVFLASGPDVWTGAPAEPAPGPFGAKPLPDESELIELLEEQTAEPTRWRFPKLATPSSTTHIARLEQALGRLKARVIHHEEGAMRAHKMLDQLRQDRDHLDAQHRTLLQEKNSLQADLIQAVGPGLTFDALQSASVRRCEQSWHMCNDWSETDWATAMAGECGEACNFIKKRRRGEPIAVEFVGKELADTVCYAVLVAHRLGLSLGAAVRAKFNEVSEEIGSEVKL